jgi:hypothetical protein
MSTTPDLVGDLLVIHPADDESAALSDSLEVLPNYRRARDPGGRRSRCRLGQRSPGLNKVGRSTRRSDRDEQRAEAAGQVLVATHRSRIDSPVCREHQRTWVEFEGRLAFVEVAGREL